MTLEQLARGVAVSPPPLPPVGGFTVQQARALMVAGRLLQSKHWPGGKVRIERQRGETYPQAVARVVRSLSVEDRDHLRELVRWSVDYEDAINAIEPATAGSGAAALAGMLR